MTITIDAKGIYYRQLNEMIRAHAAAGERRIILKNIRGQRYIGTRLTDSDLVLEVEGVPGEDLAFCMGGPTIIVRGHGQNAIANTMDSGTVVVHGIAGDALAYGMRGGKLFVRDSVGYRVGIHMKEYGDLKPAVVVGGTTGDFLGEYMAGGTLVVLNRYNEKDSVVGQADKTLATGIHGGEIFIFNYEVPAFLPGIGSTLLQPDSSDRERVKLLVEEYCHHFDLDPQPLVERDFVKIVPAGSRPFSKFYYPTYPVNTGLKPIQAEMASPCEGNCPVGVPTGRFLRYLRLGEVREALALIDDYTPFRYSNCGFICPHLCMEACSRGRVDFPVRTAELARLFHCDPEIKKSAENGKRISVIGAGPSGLSAAFFLARLGYTIDIYEADAHPGGKMYQVISRRRLPLADLEKDLDRIASLGVRLHLNTPIDARKFKAILESSDHVIAATGAHRSLIPSVQGKERILGGLDFLKAFNRREPIVLSTQIVIIGGGDVAIDGIEALSELGIKPEQITVIDIKKPSANAAERQKWEKAGVAFCYPLFLQEITEDGVWVNNPTGQGQFFPGAAIAFINEVPVMDYLPEEVKEQLDTRGFFSSLNGFFQTNNTRISIAGDATGLGLVANSIAKAKECAKQVHALLQNEPYEPIVKEVIRLEDLRLEWNQPIGCVDDVPVGDEHLRCLHCGVCVYCDECVEACPRQARIRNENEFIVDFSLCGGCGSCAAACRGGVIRMVAR
ncbi:MAG: FAD-dependent oxidoreductase [Bacillota bacterium]|nr:FAD-dependent oxidoreductase [Bacillota bacterium]MDW7684985.1 FAD-dependent oxidoreductase [Bacillota bacterium]